MSQLSLPNHLSQTSLDTSHHALKHPTPPRSLGNIEDPLDLLYGLRSCFEGLAIVTNNLAGKSSLHYKMPKAPEDGRGCLVRYKFQVDGSHYTARVEANPDLPHAIFTFDVERFSEVNTCKGEGWSFFNLEGGKWGGLGALQGFPSCRLHTRHWWMIFLTIFLPLMIQNRDRSSVNVSFTPL